MNISQRLRTCARHTGLDAVIELLNEAADEIERLSGGQPPLPTMQPGDSHMESLIEAAIQGHASTRDAMRWLVRQVMKPAQQPATPEPVGEPFCFASVNKHGDVTSTHKRRDSWRTVPLYTHPAPGVPDDVVRLVRFMEAAFVPMTPQQDEIAKALALASTALAASTAQKGGE